jgi:predicted dehydrogenase
MIVAVPGAPASFVHRERVRFRDCDAMGHANNAVYSTYLEEARIGVLGGLADFILARVEIDFRSELRAGEEVEIRSQCSRLGTKSFDLSHVMVADGRVVAEAARAADRVVQVGHIFRFHPVTATLREALGSDRIGAVRYATARFCGFKRPRTDVGVTHTDAIHYFDLFAYLLDREATRVTAVQRDYLGRGLDDMSVTTVAYGEVPVIVEANYFVPGTHRECVIVGEGGALVADYGTSTVTLHAGEHRRRGQVWEAIDTGKEELPARGEEPLRLELQAFLAACAEGRPCLVPAEAGLHALEIVEAAARAARLDRAVAIAEVR